ncbi:MAG: MFS transporter [Candidatus Odinarchaeota archaeon]|nr:MFS transporter [Candidatus Odinarchaeota archaeon]
MPEKLPPRILVTIAFLSFAGQVAWAVENQYYNVFLYNAIAPVPMYVSYMVAASAAVATITTIFMGSLSDIKGKRKIFLLVGYIAWTVTTAMFPLAALLRPVAMAVFIAILFDCIMTFFGSTAYDATFNAYVTDVTTLENRGKAVGLVQIMTLLAALLTYGASGFIIEWFGYFIFFYIVGALVGIFGVTGAILAPEPENLKPLNISIWEHIKSTFRREKIKEYKDYFLVLTGAGLWGMAVNIFFPFIIIYLQHYIKLSLEVASLLIFFALLVSIIVSYPIGILTDKIGRKKIAVVSIFMESISLFLFAISTDIVLLFITGTLWLFFMTTWSISSGTWIKDLYPEEKRGQFSGYFILFTVLFTMIPGPLIGGWLASEYGIPTIIDGQPGYIPTPIIFIAAALLILLTVIPLIPARELKREKKK